MTFLIQIAIMIVASYLAQALAPKPKQPIAASLYDFNVPTADDGTPVPVIFGTVWITGFNVLWYGALRTTPVKAASGGK